MFAKLLGPFFVAVAALLWATDSLFRLPTVAALNPVLIVAVEHLIATIVLLPWILAVHRKNLLRLGRKDWLAAGVIGLGGSSLATILFTASFSYINPSVTILLQKLQPIIVVVVAYLVLGEKPKRDFLLWAALALAAGVVLSFPDLDFSFLRSGIDLRSRGVLFALSAASLWAVATVLGKILVTSVPTSLATFWRYVFGLLSSAALVAVAGVSVPAEVLLAKPALTSLFYMSLVPGLVAMLFYYGGLARTRANVTTFVELIFPVGAVVLNTVFLDAPLSTVQLVAGAVLLASVTKLSI